MVGFITEPITTNRALDRLGTNAVPATTAEVVKAQFEESLARDPSVQIGRGLERTEGVEREAATDLLTTTPFDRDLSSTDAAVKRAQQAPVRLMDTNEANDRFGIEGKLKFDSPISERVADELNRLKREELQREDVFRRAQGGVGQWSARIGAGVVAAALDPLNVASAFIPVVGPARYSLWLERAGSAAGRVGVRAGVGAAEGTVGAALVEPIVFAGSRAEQADYDATDSMLNIAFGTILGGGLHTAFGTIADQVTGRFAREVEAMPMTEREGALRSAIAQVAEGRAVNVEAFFLRQELLSGTSLSRRVDLPSSLQENLAGSFGVMARDMPVLDVPALSKLAEIETLQIRAGEIDERLAALSFDETKALAAGESLARLDAIETRLSAPQLTAAERRTLMDRRDETLANTNPERLREIAAPLESRRALEAQRANIAARLEEISNSDAGKALAALTVNRLDIPLSARRSNLGQIQAGLREMKAEAEARARADLDRSVSSIVRQDVAGWRDPLDLAASKEITAMSAARGAPDDLPTTVKDAEALLNVELQRLTRAQQEGRLPAESPELAQADDLIRQADATGRAYEAAAACLAGRI